MRAQLALHDRRNLGNTALHFAISPPLATRYDKSPLNFLAAVKIVATRIWIRAL